MGISMKLVILVYFLTAAASIRYVLSSSEFTLKCYPKPNTFLHDLRFQCPLTVSLSSPLEVDGESLETALSSSQKNLSTAVLFHASWCPFSKSVKPKFATLSSMFPQVKHLMVEQSSAMPSVFSRYGIHSVPLIMIVNQTSRTRYHGPKDLQSLVHFYKKTTGLDPVFDLTKDEVGYTEDGQQVLQPWKRTFVKEMFMKEPYVVLSLLFLFLKAFLHFSEIPSYLAALWVAYMPHLNLGILGESRQLLGRLLHLIDIKRVWSKLKLCKTRNFHRGARSARVWASSLASVSLGDASTARAFLSEDH